MSATVTHRRLAALLALCLAGGATAQEPGLRVRLDSPDTPWVGQQVELSVDLLAPGYFASAPSFDLPDPEGVLLMPPDGHPVISNETIDGNSYTVQTHTLRAWPMRDGAQSIPAIPVRFRFKRNPLDQETAQAAVTSEPIALSVKSPPGAAGQAAVISARGLTVKESWSPQPGSEPVMAGAAFTRTVTFSAPDVPGMLFPPFPTAEVEGLGIYSKRQVQDQGDRGTLIGTRRDEITYVCQRPGTYTLPAVRYAWFDLDSGELRSEELPARTLRVIANPALPSSAATPTAGARWPVWPAATLALVVLILALAARSARLRHALGRVAAPLRPVHLQPLNPTDRNPGGPPGP